MIDHPQVIYSVNTDLDSWDIENLRYIRKISIRDSGSSETLSYVSEGDQDDQEDQQLNSSTGSGFILTSATLPNNFRHAHTPTKPSAVPARVLEEELVTRNPSRSEEVGFSACYLMDVLLVANESLARPAPALSPSGCSVDSFASAIRKGFFDMEHQHHDNQKLAKAEDLGKRRVKKSVSFMDETVQLPQQKNDNGRMMRRGGSLAGTSTGAKKPILNHRVQRFTHPEFELEPSVPWTGKLVASDTFQLGYANNWASLETYVRRLQHTNSL